jgi:hypothetical protein
LGQSLHAIALLAKGSRSEDFFLPFYLLFSAGEINVSMANESFEEVSCGLLILLGEKS